MSKQILGIHHITAIAGNPQTNLDFYAGTLGLRLVKLTVNFDDPETYHLYYGDGVGHPGTILTFFPWPKAPQGRQGVGQVTETAFAIPENAIGYWTARLSERQIKFVGPFDRFGDKVIALSDPDGLRLELVASKGAPDAYANQAGPVPLDFAIRGFHSATLSQADHRRTAELLTQTMGFKLVAQEENRFRYGADSNEPARFVDIVVPADARPGRVLAGTVHHIAWRTPDDHQQEEWLSELTRVHYGVSPVMDRKYFHSIYYREPGNILFEIATDPPGFAVDESVEQLGSRLVLPPWLEPTRQELEGILPALRLPNASASSAAL